MNEQIAPSQELVNKVINTTGESPQKFKRAKKNWKFAVLSFIIGVILISSVVAYAATLNDNRIDDEISVAYERYVKFVIGETDNEITVTDEISLDELSFEEIKEIYENDLKEERKYIMRNMGMSYAYWRKLNFNCEVTDEYFYITLPGAIESFEQDIQEFIEEWRQYNSYLEDQITTVYNAIIKNFDIATLEDGREAFRAKEKVKNIEAMKLLIKVYEQSDKELEQFNEKTRNGEYVMGDCEGFWAGDVWIDKVWVDKDGVIVGDLILSLWY